MTLRPSWRSTLETWVVQAADAVDHVAAGAVAAVVAALLVKAAVKPPGRSVEEGLTRYSSSFRRLSYSLLHFNQTSQTFAYLSYNTS